jgi:hypothetical protein
MGGAAMRKYIFSVVVTIALLLLVTAVTVLADSTGPAI